MTVNTRCHSTVKKVLKKRPYKSSHKTETKEKQEEDAAYTSSFCEYILFVTFLCTVVTESVLTLM
jgi:hypothetical protein